MEKIFDIASKVSTPLGLAGIFAVILFYILKILIEKGKMRVLSGSLIEKIINKLFLLALVAMVLGFLGFAIQAIGSVFGHEKNYTLLLSGKVVDANTNLPVANAEIALEGFPLVFPSVYSDSEGTFFKEIICKSISITGRIIVRRKSYADLARNLTLTMTPADLLLKISPAESSGQKQGGTYSVTIRTGEYTWSASPEDNIPQTLTSGKGTPGNDSIMQFILEIPNFHLQPSAGSLRFFEAKETNCLGPCHGWRKYEYGPMVIDSGRRITAQHRNWGDPVTVTVTGLVEKWTKIKDITETINGINYTPSQATIEIALPEDFLGVLWHGRTNDGVPFSIAFDRDNANDGLPIPITAGTPFSYLTNFVANGKRIYRFSVN